MFKVLKIFLAISIAAILAVGYCVYLWHFRGQETFLSVDRPCDAVKIAKELCADEDNSLNEECYYGRIPKQGAIYLVRDFVFGHRCTDTE